MHSEAAPDLQDSRNRIWHTRLGWITRDPTGYPDGLNTYAGYHILHGGVDPNGQWVWLAVDFAFSVGSQIMDNGWDPREWDYVEIGIDMATSLVVPGGGTIRRSYKTVKVLTKPLQTFTKVSKKQRKLREWEKLARDRIWKRNRNLRQAKKQAVDRFKKELPGSIASDVAQEVVAEIAKSMRDAYNDTHYEAGQECGTTTVQLTLELNPPLFKVVRKDGIEYLVPTKPYRANPNAPYWDQWDDPLGWKPIPIGPPSLLPQPPFPDIGPWKPWHPPLNPNEPTVPIWDIRF